MALVATRVLVINQQLSFAVMVKQTLEQSGMFDVSPFTSAETAADYLRQHPQDIALVDMTLPSRQGTDIVFQLRAIQSDIAIIATPDNPDVAAISDDLDLQGVIDMPCAARDLIPLIQHSVARMRDTLPDTAEAPPVEHDSETLVIHPADAEEPPANGPVFSNLDRVVGNMGGLEMPGEETLGLDDTPVSDSHSVSTARSASPLEVVLPDQPPSGLSEAPAPSEARKPPQHEEALFEQLAAEEPPIPTLEESGTVRDLMLGVNDTNLGQVLSIMRGDDVADAVQNDAVPDSDEEDEAAGDKSLAQLVLEAALDESTPLENFSIADLLNNLDSQIPPHHPVVSPLPSWLRESDRYVREPDFLPEMDQTGEYMAQTTQPSSAQQIESSPEQLETDRLEITHRSASTPEVSPETPPETVPEELPEISPDAPPQTLPEALPEMEPVSEIDDDEDTVRGEPLSVEPVGEAESPDEPTGERSLEAMTEAMPVEEIEAFQADFEKLAELEMVPISDDVENEDEDAAEAEIEPEMVEEIDDDQAVYDDPYITQLALNLTQVSLELTAQATLLTQEGQIVAYAGPLPREEIEGLDEVCASDWDATPNQARIRFITLPSSGQDYMLYSRRTVGDFTLSMIFAATMPLRAIRRQSNRLTQALESVPEAVEEPPQPGIEEIEPVDEVQALPEPAEPIALPESVGPLEAFAYIWLVRDPVYALNEPTARAIADGLRTYLENKAWGVTLVDVQEDYVYVLIDAPAESLPHEVIRDLMGRSAEIAYSHDSALDPEALWSDSYLVETSGRELTIEEIQEFINFARDE
jgi:CheY-like chemotaxis protein/REP element-mobilizing transposase RayT